MNKEWKPASDHPWRRYKNKQTSNGKKTNGQKPLFLFLSEIIECWETYTVDSTDVGKYGLNKFSQLNDQKRAEWLVDFLSRHYTT